jgi:hypothetical protein
MPDDSKTAAIPPVQVAVIGGTGDGSPLTTGTTATTPDHQPNLVLKVISPLAAIVTRGINLFLTTWVALVTAGQTGIGTTLLPHEFYPLALTCAKVAGVAVLIGAAKDTITIFSKLERNFPLATGSV